jgi:hypothetical protein
MVDCNGSLCCCSGDSVSGGGGGVEGGRGVGGDGSVGGDGGVEGDGGVVGDGDVEGDGGVEDGCGDFGDGDFGDGDRDLQGEVGESAGGEMVRCQFLLSSWPLRSSSSQRRFHVFFAGSGAVGEIFPGRDVGEDRC